MQALKAECLGNRLSLSWIRTADCKAIIIQIARDSEFTEDLHQYLIPPQSQSIVLDSGKGAWIFRAGILKAGKVEWSGIYGPALVDSQKSSQILGNPHINIIHTQAIVNGYRIITDAVKPSYTIIEYTTASNFLASNTKTLYYEDSGRGYFDCAPLDSSFSYNIRITTTSEVATLPTDAIHVLQNWLTINNKRPMALKKLSEGGDKSLQKKDLRILKEVNESKKPIQFKSGEEYTRYLATLRITRGKLD